MGRLIAIDYGTRRTGLAVSDESRTFAFGLTTVPTHTLLAWLDEYMKKETVDAFIVGEPKRMNNLPTQATEHVESFIKSLVKKFPGMKIFRIDERFTSKMAKQSKLDSGVRKSQRAEKELVDMVSATIILQSFLEQEANRPKN